MIFELTLYSLLCCEPLIYDCFLSLEHSPSLLFYTVGERESAKRTTASTTKCQDHSDTGRCSSPDGSNAGKLPS